MISRICLWYPYVKMRHSTKDGILLQTTRWSRIALSIDGLTFLNVKGDIPIRSADLTFWWLSVHTYIYKPLQTLTLRKKCPYSKLLWSAFSRIRNEYGEILRIPPYSVQMPKNTDQNNSEYGHFSHSVSL